MRGSMWLFHHHLFALSMLCYVFKVDLRQVADPCITSTDLSLTCESFLGLFSIQSNITPQMVTLINIRNRDNCYVLVSNPKSWSDANRVCIETSGRLVWIAYPDGAVNSALHTKLRLAINNITNTSNMTWIGMKTENDTTYWECPFNNGTNLYSGRIKYLNDKYCGYVNEDRNSVSFTSRCSQPLHFLCELVLPLSIKISSTIPHAKVTSTSSQTPLAGTTFWGKSVGVGHNAVNPTGSNLTMYIWVAAAGFVFFLIAFILGVWIIKREEEKDKIDQITINDLVNPARGPCGYVNVDSYFLTPSTTSISKSETTASADNLEG